MKSGMELMMGSMGIDPTEIKNVINDFKTNGPIIIKSVVDRVTRIEEKLDKILALLEAEKSSVTLGELAKMEEINSGS